MIRLARYGLGLRSQGERVGSVAVDEYRLPVFLPDQLRKVVEQRAVALCALAQGLSRPVADLTLL